ncbi:MAG: GntR family transcriptional regulator [Hyphomicrobiales bacterium]|nr:GntR family transcriptional regulator [Hyphomicrobiales bacterium]
MNDKPAEISRESERPLYLQLVEALERRIHSAEISHGNMLPSEALLVEQYKVSRITVRQALSNLEDRGLIYRRQGKGTFVRAPQVKQKLNREAKTIIEALRERGHEPDVKVLALEQLLPPAHVSELLGTADQQVTRLRRSYSVDGAPIALVDLFLPLAMSGVAHVLARDDHLKETSYSVFEEEMHIPIKEVKHIIHTRALTPDVAAALNMQPDEMCLTLDRITYSTTGNVLELMTFYYATDSFHFEITLPRHAEHMALKIARS